MCGNAFFTTHTEWRERALVEDGGKRYDITDVYGKDQHGLLIHDHTFPEDWYVTIHPDGNDIEGFSKESEALDYLKQHGMIVPTATQKRHIEQGDDLFETYGGKTMAEWVEIGELNNREHVHPEPPDDLNDRESLHKFITAYVFTMTMNEMMNALGNMLSFGSVLGELNDMFDTTSTMPNLDELFS